VVYILKHFLLGKPFLLITEHAAISCADSVCAGRRRNGEAAEAQRGR